MSTHPQIPEDVAALITAHALGALEPDQAALAEQHIAASDDCRRAYEDALETAAALALAVADSEPPPELRDRIVAAARAERLASAPDIRAPAPRRRLRLAGLLTPFERLRSRRHRRGGRLGADRRLAAQLRDRCARPPGGARIHPLGAGCSRGAAAVERGWHPERPHRRLARPCRARELAARGPGRSYLPGLGPTGRRRLARAVADVLASRRRRHPEGRGALRAACRYRGAERRLAGTVGGALCRRESLVLRPGSRLPRSHRLDAPGTTRRLAHADLHERRRRAVPGTPSRHTHGKRLPGRSTRRA